MLRELHGHTGGEVTAVFSADGTRLATGAKDRTLRLWDTANGKELAAWPTGEFQPRPVAFTPDGKRLFAVTGDAEGARWRVEVWDVAAGKRLNWWDPLAATGDTPKVRTPPPVGAAGQVPTFAVRGLASADGRRLAVQVSFGQRYEGGSAWSGEARVAVCDALSGELVRHFEFERGLTSVAFAPDGKTLASGHDNGAVWLWDVQSGEKRREYAGHRGRVLGLAFSPDGRRLVSGSEDTTALIWEVSQ